VASLASEHDMLRAESVELEQEIKRIDSAEAFKDDPGAISSLREEAEKWEKRLSRVRSELAATEKTLEGVNRRMAACEAALSEALTSRTALARQLAGELFLLGARTDSVTILDLRGALTDAIADWSEAAESDWEPESDPRFAELVQKAVVARQAEIDELTRRLRNESVHHPGDPDFRRLAAAWSRLTPQRRARLLEFAEDQRRLSLQEGVEREEVVAIEERASARKTRR
jgi:septal ring factor EnvC (AmiA/AmiB activator)